MILDSQKELTPVIYDRNGIKLLAQQTIPPHSLCFPLHWHDRFELSLIHSGSFKLMLEEKAVDVHAGQNVIINPGQLHGGISGETGVIYSTLMFEPIRLINDIPSVHTLIQPLIDHHIVFNNICSEDALRLTFESLVQEASITDEASPLYVQSKLYVLLGFLYRSCQCHSSTITIVDDQFHTVLEYINTNFCHTLTTTQLSKQFGYDKSYFCRRFKSITSLTITNYLQILRLERAQKLLQDSNMNIREIALTCGFSDAGYFSRIFKKHYGISPTDYQHNHYKKLTQTHSQVLTKSNERK